VPSLRRAELERLLSGDERARAARFFFERDRDRFVVGRGLLREILGRCVGSDPTALAFDYGNFGKPFLPDAGVSFNVAHAGDVLVVAALEEGEVGVDVELVSNAPVEERVAEHFFSRREVLALRALPEAEQPAAFFRCWTRKEAYIKAIGLGMQVSLHDFAVTLTASEPPALLWTAWSPSEPSRWCVYDLSRFVAPAAAALVVPSGTGAVTVQFLPRDGEGPPSAVHIIEGGE
jgi:4'-phosphopantetheinyl transferase